MKPAIIVHGGAGDWPEEDYEEAVKGVHEAVTIGWRILQNGGSALDAVEKATNFLEDHPLFDAGIGSHLTRLGEVEMDALIIDGTNHRFGAVAGLKHIQYPISLARYIMTETPHCFIIGEGAEHLAREWGFPILPNLTFITAREEQLFREGRGGYSGSMGTVGAVALDLAGNIAAATSTGGTRNKLPGRIGDSPLFGAGGYANPDGAASATGLGENIMRVLLSKYAIDQVSVGKNAQEAATASAHYINSFYAVSNAGIITIDREGRVGAAHTTAAMPIAWSAPDGTLESSMGGGINGLIQTLRTQ